MNIARFDAIRREKLNILRPSSLKHRTILMIKKPISPQENRLNGKLTDICQRDGGSGSNSGNGLPMI